MQRVTASILIATVVACVPFCSNFFGGFFGGFSPSSYFGTVGIVIFILSFNAINAVISVLIFNNLYAKRKSLVAITPIVVGVLSMAYFNFGINIYADALAAVGAVAAAFFAIPFFVIPWIIVRVCGNSGFRK